jgi:hypothetical protein
MNRRGPRQDRLGRADPGQKLPCQVGIRWSFGPTGPLGCCICLLISGPVVQITLLLSLFEGAMGIDLPDLNCLPSCKLSNVPPKPIKPPATGKQLLPSDPVHIDDNCGTVGNNLGACPMAAWHL